MNPEPYQLPRGNNSPLPLRKVQFISSQYPPHNGNRPLFPLHQGQFIASQYPSHKGNKPPLPLHEGLSSPSKYPLYSKPAQSLLLYQRVGVWYRIRRRGTKIGLGCGVLVGLLCMYTLAAYRLTPTSVPVAKQVVATVSPTVSPILQATVAPTPRLRPTATTTPKPTATQAPTGGSDPGHAAIIAMIDRVFGPDAPEAVRIARCESGLNPKAYNPGSGGGSHPEGLFQILYPSTWGRTSQASRSPFDAMANILAAHEIFVRDGHSWREWSCR